MICFSASLTQLLSTQSCIKVHTAAEATMPCARVLGLEICYIQLHFAIAVKKYDWIYQPHQWG